MRYRKGGGENYERILVGKGMRGDLEYGVWRSGRAHRERGRSK